MRNYNQALCYPYAYGALDAGLDNFANHFEMLARMKGFDIDSELFAFMKEELNKLGDEVHNKSAEHKKQFG